MGGVLASRGTAATGSFVASQGINTACNKLYGKILTPYEWYLSSAIIFELMGLLFDVFLLIPIFFYKKHINGDILKYLEKHSSWILKIVDVSPFSSNAIKFASRVNKFLSAHKVFDERCANDDLNTNNQEEVQQTISFEGDVNTDSNSGDSISLNISNLQEDQRVDSHEKSVNIDSGNVTNPEEGQQPAEEIAEAEQVSEDKSLYTPRSNEEVWGEMDNDSVKQKIPFLTKIQIFYVIYTFCYSIISLESSLSNWEKYEYLYGCLVDLLVVTLVTTVLSIANIDDKEGNSLDALIMAWTFVTCVAILAPIIVTHIIPAIVMYCWIVLICGVAFAIAVGYAAVGMVILYVVFIILVIVPLRYVIKYFLGYRNFSFGTETKIYSEKFYSIMLMSFGRFFGAIIIITAFNYSVLNWEQGSHLTSTHYLSTITREYALHTQSKCYFEHTFDNARGVMNFLSFI